MDGVCLVEDATSRRKGFRYAKTGGGGFLLKKYSP